MKYRRPVWIALTLFSHMRRRSHVSYDAVCVMQLVSFANFSTFLWVCFLNISSFSSNVSFVFRIKPLWAKG